MSDTFSPETTVRAVDDQISTEIEDEMVVLQLDTGTYFGIDGVGPRVWELLQEPLTVGELEDELLNEYDISRDRLHQDVDELLCDLRDASLIEYEEA